MFSGGVVEAMCSGVWGIDQGSFHLTADVDRYLVERRTLGCNARVREMKWCRKIDMVRREKKLTTSQRFTSYIHRL